MKQQKILENAEIAELLGAFIGDGWIQAPGTSLYICGSPTEDKEYYDNFLAPLFSKHFAPVKPKNFKYWGVYGINTSNSKAIKKAIKQGFQIGKKAHSASIPQNIIHTRNESVIIPLLRGIFDADGCFYCKKEYGIYNKLIDKKYPRTPRMCLRITSKVLIEQVSALLSMLEIDHRCSSREARKRATRNYAAEYQIWINKKTSIERFYKIVGSNNPRHITRYQVWKKLGYLPSGTDIYERKAILRAIVTDNAIKVAH